MQIFFRISSSSVSKRTTFIIQRSQVSISVSRQFCKMLQRGLSVNRLVISFDNENLSSRKMIEIWSLVNADQISSQVSAKFKIAPPEVVNACKIIRVISEENISLSLVLVEWSSLIKGGRRIEDICVWISAVVERLVLRNNSLPDRR